MMIGLRGIECRYFIKLNYLIRNMLKLYIQDYLKKRAFLDFDKTSASVDPLADTSSSSKPTGQQN